MAEFFVNCDWGTTRFRLRLIRVDGVALAAEVRSDDGVAPIAARGEPPSRAQEFRSVLEQRLRELGDQFGRPLGPIPIVISGMASSSIGWQELPYARVPWNVDGSDLVWRELDPVSGAQGHHRTILVSGARTETDVMRGEETEVVGLFQLGWADSLGGRATVIMPGTHSKHVRAEGRRIVDFRTFVTGELMDVIGRHSTLRHSVGAEALLADDLSGDGLASFVAGLELARDLPLSAALFRVRTRQVLDGSSPRAGRALLSGILIGGELSYLAGGAQRDLPIVLCAASPLDRFYSAALDFFGLSARSTVVAGSEVERLSALGQACLARRGALI